MIIYTNGCSHTAGHCMKRAQTWPHLVMRSLIGNVGYSNNITPSTIRKNSNVLYNQAMHGAGNDYIFHTSLETISALIDTGNKPDYVIIQWSGPNRRMHSDENGGFIFVNPWDNGHLGVKFEPMGSQHTLHYMFSLQEILKKNNIKYWFFNYMKLAKLVKKSNIYTLLDLDRFIHFEYDNILFEGLIDYFRKKDMCCDEGCHPNQDANYLIGKNVVEKMGGKVMDKTDFYNVPVI